MVDAYYEALANNRVPEVEKSEVIYSKAALEAKFGRKFSLEEVKTLLSEEYGPKSTENPS